MPVMLVVMVMLLRWYVLYGAGNARDADPFLPLLGFGMLRTEW